jgi:hypothetical protein
MATIKETGDAPADSLGDSVTENDLEVARPKEQQENDDLDWDNSPHNPSNWPAWKKALQVVMLSSSALLA